MSSQPKNRSSDYTVVVHTYDRPEYLERDLAHGRWSDVPLLIMDDGSRESVQSRLRAVAEAVGGRFESRAENGGVALAARDGVHAAGTPHVMLCGDDDYLRDMDRFVPAARRALLDPETLFAVMPEVVSLHDSGRSEQQYDRSCFDGMTGREMLRELASTGEMRALQAGTMFRTDDIRSLFAEPFFRTSEDFVLLCRLCAANPDARVRVVQHGAYVRRVHSRSLSHPTNTGIPRVAQNALGSVVGSLLLESVDAVDRAVTLGALRKRGRILRTVYGTGAGVCRVMEALLRGERPEPRSAEEEETLAVLRDAELPREVAGDWSPLIETTALATESHDLVPAAEALLEQGATSEALTLLDAAGDDPTAMGLKARALWTQGDPAAAVRLLGDALVRDPEHAENLYLMTQAAAAAGAETERNRLAGRLADLLGAEALEALGIEEPGPVDDLRVAFVVKDGLDQFLDDLMRELLPRFNVRKFVVRGTDDIDEALSWADILWFEWCNEPLVYATHQDAAREKAIICRLHRYEAFTGMPQQVQWDRVDTLVVVAEHIGSLLKELVPGLDSKTRLVHIPNGLNLDDFEFRSREHGFDVALVGYLHGRKNPTLALQVIRGLVDRDARYRLHVAGKFQDPIVKMYWNHAVQSMGLAENVVMHGWQNDMPTFLSDKSALLSASMHESFGYTIAEAMAAGIKPVVHHFPFATDMWPAEMLFDTVNEAVEMIDSREVHSAAYRAFIEDHYSLKTQVERTEALLRAAAMRLDRRLHPVEVDAILRIEPEAANARLAVRCGACGTETTLQQQSIAGVPVGMEACSACGTMAKVDPDAYIAALEQFESRVVAEDPFEITRAIRHVAMHWSERPAWQDAMQYEDIDLGACMAFDLTPRLVGGWLASHQSDLAA